MSSLYKKDFLKASINNDAIRRYRLYRKTDSRLLKKEVPLLKMDSEWGNSRIIYIT